MAAKSEGESGESGGKGRGRTGVGEPDASAKRSGKLRRGIAGGSDPVPGPAPREGRRDSDVGAALYVAQSAIHGTGMFAAEPLAADTSLGRLAGMPTHEDGTYVLWLTDELGLEVTNDFRFINHDKDPNCELTDVDVVTLRRIEIDEELTHDYGW